MNEKLIPCPFCGGKLKKISQNAVKEWVVWHVCKKPHLLIAWTFESLAEAIKAWNRRAK